MTRMMQQYHDAKAQHPGMIVLFRNGEFYELFEDDAILANRVLGLTLTKRDGVIRHHHPRRDGSVRDTVMFSVLASEWPDVRRHLSSRLAAHGSRRA